MDVVRIDSYRGDRPYADLQGTLRRVVPVIKFLKGLIFLPWRQMFDVLRVFAFGAKKHNGDLWFEAGYDTDHFINKAHRHYCQWTQGKRSDEETGVHPLAHAICDYLMAWALDIRDKK